MHAIARPQEATMLHPRRRRPIEVLSKQREVTDRDVRCPSGGDRLRLMMPNFAKFRHCRGRLTARLVSRPRQHRLMIHVPGRGITGARLWCKLFGGAAVTSV